MPLHKIVELGKTSRYLVDTLNELQKQGIIQSITDGKYLVIARFTVNKSTLRGILNDHKVCCK